MSTYTGSNGLIKSGANTIGQITSFEITEEVDLFESTGLGDTAKTRVVGNTDFKATVTAIQDSLNAGQADLIIGASITLTVRMEGVTVGNEELTGTGIVKTISQTSEANGLVTKTFSLEGTGGLTRGAIA
jgi:hypothetical protein